MTLRGGRRAGTREWGHTGMDEGGTMMMITITVILEGWKSRHALLPVLTHSAADFSLINCDMIKGIANCFRKDNWNVSTLVLQARLSSVKRDTKHEILLLLNAFKNLKRTMKNMTIEGTHPCRSCRRI